MISEKMFRELGTPARIKRDAETPEDIENFRKQHNNFQLYISVYGFEKLDPQTQAPDYSSAVIDRAFWEIENPKKNSVLNQEVLKEERKLIRTIQKLKIPYPKILFSGARGFHHTYYFSSLSLKYPNMTLKEAVESVVEKEWGINYLDHASLKGVTQMKRLVNSKHAKTGLFAIPILPKEILNLGCDEIFELAKQPRKIFYEKQYVNFLRDYLLIIDNLIAKRVEDEEKKKIVNPLKQTSPLYFKKFQCCDRNSEIPPCINKLMQKLKHGVNLTHFERFIFVSFMGKYLENKNKEEVILEFFKNEPDYNDKKTRYQIRHILSKGYYPPRCEKLKKIGLCKTVENHP